MSDRDPKSQILDAALSTFVELGFERATIAQIRARAGISNGALFHHFPSKGAIAEALYLRGIATYQDGLLTAIKSRPGNDNARATIKAAVDHHLVWVEENRNVAWFMYEQGRPDWPPTHGATVRKLNRATAVHIGQWIAPLAAAGVVRNLPLPALAACVLGPAHFIARRWVSGLINSRPSSFTDVLADAAWAALAPGKHRRAREQHNSRSPSALIEAAAIDAARAACPASPSEGWTVAQLIMNVTSPHAEFHTTHVRSRRLEGTGRVAFVDIDLIDAAGEAVTSGHVVCIRGERIAPAPFDMPTPDAYKAC